MRAVVNLLVELPCRGFGPYMQDDAYDTIFHQHSKRKRG